MGKLLALTVALPVAAVAAGAGYLTWNNVQRYEAEEQRLLTNVRQELQAQGLALDAEPVSRGLFGVFREDIYTLRDIAQATDLIAVRQTTTIEPLRAYGTFAVDGERGLAAMLFSSLPGLLEGQQGSWQLDARNNLTSAQYRTGAVDMQQPDGSQVRMAPMVIESTTELDGARRSRSVASWDGMQVSTPVGLEVSLGGVTMNVSSRQIGNTPFIERFDYRIGRLSADAGDKRLALRGMAMEQGSVLQNGVVASLLTLTFDDLSFSSGNQDLRVDPSELGLFFDGLNWAALQRANDRLQQLSQNSEGIEAAVAALAEVGAHGASLTLEQLNSRFIFNDRGPAGIGAAGDVSANGRLTLRAGAAATLADEWLARTDAFLHLELSRSLMQSPLSEYMLELINTGYLREEGDRLISDFRFAAGELTANDLPLDDLAQAL